MATVDNSERMVGSTLYKTTGLEVSLEAFLAEKGSLLFPANKTDFPHSLKRLSRPLVWRDPATSRHVALAVEYSRVNPLGWGPAVRLVEKYNILSKIFQTNRGREIMLLRPDQLKEVGISVSRYLETVNVGLFEPGEYQSGVHSKSTYGLEEMDLNALNQEGWRLHAKMKVFQPGDIEIQGEKPQGVIGYVFNYRMAYSDRLGKAESFPQVPSPEDMVQLCRNFVDEFHYLS